MRRPAKGSLPDRGVHPYADQFTDEWAWRFEDSLRRLAAESSNAGEFWARVATVGEALEGQKHEMAVAWATFVARKAADRGQELPVEEVLRRVGRPVPFVRAVNPGRTPAVTPERWVTEPIGLWKGVPAEVVYDPGRHDVLVTRRTGAQQAQAIEARGFTVGAADGHRTFWHRDRDRPPAVARDRDGNLSADGPPGRDRDPAAAVRVALARLEQQSDPGREPPGLGVS